MGGGVDVDVEIFTDSADKQFFTRKVVNMTNTKYGCHNREPYREAQVLHGLSSRSGLPVRVLVPNRMARDCQYTKTALGQKDKGCSGCKWRSGPTPPVAQGPSGGVVASDPVVAQGPSGEGVAQ